MSTGHPDDRKPFDDAVDGAWREGSTEQPPARVDAAILAEARKRRSRFTGWPPLAAAAAIACLAFVLVQMMPREHTIERPISIESATPPAAPPQVTTEPPPQPAQAQAQASIIRAVPPAPEPEPAPAAAAAASSEAVAPSEAEVTEAARTELPPSPAAAVPAARESDSRSDVMAGAPAPTRAEASRSMSKAADAAVTSPQQWAAKIASLHASGDLESAAAELRRFRSTYADADGYLPEELRGWAATLK